MLDGKKVKLLAGLERWEQGRYVEQQIEKWLGLTDRKVSGEAKD